MVREAGAVDGSADVPARDSAQVPAPVVRLQDVSFAYEGGPAVLRDVNLTITAGERVAIVGPSGAGKSTLLRTINGLLLPTHGEVWALGERITALSESSRRVLRTRVGMVFQEFALVERLSVLTNVLIGRLGYVSEFRTLVRAFPSSDVEMARMALAEVGLAGTEQRLVRHLSGGQKQRVAIARAIVQGPRLILADEPTANLDVRTADEVLRLLVEVGERHGTTLVLNLHDVRAARRYCQRVVVLQGGTIVWEGPSALFDDAAVSRVFYGESASDPAGGDGPRPTSGNVVGRGE